MNTTLVFVVFVSGSVMSAYGVLAVFHAVLFHVLSPRGYKISHEFVMTNNTAACWAIMSSAFTVAAGARYIAHMLRSAL